MDVQLTYKATGLVMAGGAIGAALRFHGTQLAVRLGHTGYPFATLGINVVGGLAMGVLAALVLREHVGEPIRLFVAVGVLGGFTTFSAFSLEMFQMIERGQTALALGYALLSVALSLAALAAGYTVTRGLT
ncbi:fluoride efflux transporter CrcB [Blastomonas aquatica]|uniref:Fluoride-specific ion channel FluC n=1 Tax=Blastomonas aquatica TaxID=1510276 RepID=A0ABQ1JH29_9SPHN|nr:fluoride efflux transporter CrcB [Blastomonas aquatica]GGB68362.1 putative fluoride ion transporter CrcB [Blastomonas aquatica]